MNLSVESVLGSAAGAAESSKSLFDYVAEGGSIGLIIILLSLVAVGLIIAQSLQIRMSRLAPPEQVDRLDELLQGADIKGATEFCTAADNDSFLTRVFGSALVRCQRSAFGFLELKTALEESGQTQVARLYRWTETLGLIASVAPMLGLLGTVVGMVQAFERIGLGGGGAVDPGELAGPISQALITTVLGLIVAIPCTAAYTYLRNRIDAVTTDIVSIIEDLAAYLESPTAGRDRQRAGGQAGPRAAARPGAGPQPAQAAAPRPGPGQAPAGGRA